MNKDLLQGKLVTLKPALPNDCRIIFQWMTESDISSKMFGPPTYPEVEAPDWEEFLEDYTLNYFTEEAPLNGRCFLINVADKLVGQINYNSINVQKKQTELDIWLSDNSVTRKGYGTDAILTLCRFLQKKYGCTSFMIQPSARNPAAIAAYRKVGFDIIKTLPTDFVPDYYDSVVMVKSLV